MRFENWIRKNNQQISLFWKPNDDDSASVTQNRQNNNHWQRPNMVSRVAVGCLTTLMAGPKPFSNAGKAIGEFQLCQDMHAAAEGVPGNGRKQQFMCQGQRAKNPCHCQSRKVYTSYHWLYKGAVIAAHPHAAALLSCFTLARLSPQRMQQ